MHTMALLMTITRVKISAMRSTAKHWDINKQQWKAVAKKSRALHFTGWKTSREQMEEMLNNRRHRKLTKKLPKGPTTSPKDGTNFEKVLIEKMEQHNWTLLVACKIKKKKKCPELDADYIKFISYGRVNDEPRYSANYTHWFAISLHKCHSSDLVFKNNHGNPSSGELYYSPWSGQPNCGDTIFRGSHRNCSVKKRS